MLRRIAPAFTLIEGFADRLVCVLGAIFAAQAPEFFQQYLQRLGGHLAEINRQLAAFEAAAHAAGKPWLQFVADTTANPDPGLAKLGATMSDTAARAADLATAHAALLNASVWSRPWAFITHLDLEIAHATAAIFKPAVPTTVEGAIYAAIGVGVVFGVWHLLVRLPMHRALGRGKSGPSPVGVPPRR